MKKVVGVHNENKRVVSGSSCGEDISDSEKAQGIFDDWVISLPLQSHKMLAAMLMETLQKRTNIKSIAAALEAAWIHEKRLFVVTERNSLRILALSVMNLEDSISDSAYSTRRHYTSNSKKRSEERCSQPGRLRVLPVGEEQAFAIK